MSPACSTAIGVTEGVAVSAATATPTPASDEAITRALMMAWRGAKCMVVLPGRGDLRGAAFRPAAAVELMPLAPRMLGRCA